MKIACPYCNHVQIFGDSGVCGENDNDDDEKKGCGTFVSKQFLRAVEKTPPIYLATVGFTQHGKTTYLDSMMTMIENLGKISGRTYHEYMDNYTREEVQKMRYQVQNRIKADSTTVSEEAVPMLIGIHNFLDLPVHPMVIYDLSGEIFDIVKGSKNVQDKDTYAVPMTNAHTIWFFVSVEDLENPERVQGSAQSVSSMSDLFALYRNSMESHGVSLKGRNLLIIYTKADEVVSRLPSVVRNYMRSDKYYDLDQKRRKDALQLGFNPDAQIAEIERISDELKEWTYDIQGGTPFINMVEESGMNVVFTVTSSIGRESSRNVDRMLEFRRYRVLDPLLWSLMHNQGIGGDRQIVLILDSTENADKVYSNDLPYYVYDHLSGKGNVVTYYMGQATSVSRVGTRPPDIPSEDPTPSLIGPILDTLDNEEALVVILLDRPNHRGGDAIFDLSDYDTPQWRNRIGIFAFQDGLVEWERSEAFTQPSEFKTVFDEVFPRLET